MARKLRVEYPGVVYHVLNRGDRRQDIFHDDRDQELFLDAPGEACRKARWLVRAYCCHMEWAKGSSRLDERRRN